MMYEKKPKVFQIHTHKLFVSLEWRVNDITVNVSRQTANSLNGLALEYYDKYLCLYSPIFTNPMST